VTGTARTGNRILGSLRSADGQGIVRVEDRYDTDIEDLWSALTDPARLARWIAEVDGDLRLGVPRTLHQRVGGHGSHRSV
jgi:uncharacterized protein YndB with AHSA1/START domain